MNLIEESYTRLFPNRDFSHKTYIEYNRRLSAFNANIALDKKTLKVHLNLQWKDIDDEIKIGLIQHLLCKVLKHKAHTQNISLYNSFIKNIPLLTARVTPPAQLENSYNRICSNLLPFSDLSHEPNRPNIKWGRESFRKLGCYNFHDDTITISTIFKDAPEHLLDLVMHHELLHKHFKFEHNNGRNSYHGPAFKSAEREFPQFEEAERELTRYIRQKMKGKTRKKPKFTSLFGRWHKNI